MIADWSLRPRLTRGADVRTSPKSPDAGIRPGSEATNAQPNNAGFTLARAALPDAPRRKSREFVCDGPDGHLSSAFHGVHRSAETVSGRSLAW